MSELSAQVKVDSTNCGRSGMDRGTTINYRRLTTGTSEHNLLQYDLTDYELNVTAEEVPIPEFRSTGTRLSSDLIRFSFGSCSQRVTRKVKLSP
jgi:hypothetical protein